MELQPHQAPVPKRAQVGQQSGTAPRELCTSPQTVLLVAIWIGLNAGWLDLALLIVKNKVFAVDFYRLGAHFIWIIPAGVGMLVTVPGMAFAVWALVRGGRVKLGFAVGFFSFIASLDVCARLPIEFWAGLLLSGGIAIQLAWLADNRREPFLWLVRRTCSFLVGAVLVMLVVSFGRQAWSEYRSIAALPPSPARARNLLLITWDTVRTGNLSLHGYRRQTTPNLERFAGLGARFDRAFATAPWTLPSHSSIFTAKWPHELTSGWLSPLDETQTTLAEYLTAHGYDTAGFVANLDYCSWETGLSRGFAHYEDFPLALGEVFTRYIGLGSRLDLITPASVLNRLLKAYFGDSYDVIPRSNEHAKNAAAINNSLLNWLSWQKGRGRPFFAFLNYNDAHSPYEVPDRSIPAFGLRPVSYLDRATLKSWDTLDKSKVSPVHIQMAIDVYDDSIFYMDHQFGMLVDELNRQGVLDNTLVIVASDHGEHLGDHGLFFHGCSLYQQLVSVPLVIVSRGRVPKGRVIVSPISLRDIPATVVDLLELNEAARFPGRSLGRFWRANGLNAELTSEPVLMEADKPPALTNQGREPVAKGPMQAIVSEGMHYIRSADGFEELYFLDSDPEEQSSVVAYPGAAETLKQLRARMSAALKK
jgi:arylsulfatase A-like enzyme